MQEPSTEAICGIFAADILRLVVEDAAEVLAVGEDLVLLGQERAARVDEVDARQLVLEGDLLGAQVLLHRHRVVGAALDGGVVGDDEHLSAVHHADAGDDAGAGAGAAVQALGGERRDLQERAALSSSWSTRSRGSSLPRARWRSRDRSGPPSAAAARRC